MTHSPSPRYGTALGLSPKGVMPIALSKVRVTTNNMEGGNGEKVSWIETRHGSRVRTEVGRTPASSASVGVDAPVQQPLGDAGIELPLHRGLDGQVGYEGR